MTARLFGCGSLGRAARSALVAGAVLSAFPGGFLHAYERLQGPTELLFADKAKAFPGYTLFGVGGRTYLIDLDGKVVGEVPGTAGVHGVAFSRELDRGWTSNGQAGTVTVFKLSTLDVVGTVKATGENPDAILYEPATKRVFSFNARGKNATVIDAVTSQVVGTIPMSGKPEFAACDGKGLVYVNNGSASLNFSCVLAWRESGFI